MRPVVALEAPVAGFRIHLSPPVVVLSSSLTFRAAPPAAATTCDSHTCPWWPYSNSKDFSTNAAMILIILFCLFFCALALAAAIRYLLRRRRGGHPFHDDLSRSIEAAAGGVEQQYSLAVPKAALSSTVDLAQMAAPPMLVFSTGMKLAGAEAECPICLSEFVEGEGIRVLGNCNHGFHVQCIQKWITSQSSCPTCRSNIFLSPSSSDPPPPPPPPPLATVLGNGAHVAMDSHQTGP